MLGNMLSGDSSSSYASSVGCYDTNAINLSMLSNV